jgi:hypothetical protein
MKKREIMVTEKQPLSKSRSLRLSRLSIHTRIIGSFLLVSLAPICLIGTFSYFRCRATIIQKTAGDSLDMLTQTVANLRLKLAEFESVSVRLFINQDFHAALARYINSQDSPAAGRENIESYFNEYMISNKDIYAFMFIVRADPRRSIVIAKDFSSDFQEFARRFQRTDSYRNMITAGGGIVWSNTINIQRNHFLVLGRYLKDGATGAPLGILAIVADEDRIDQLANLTLYTKLNISLGNMESYSFIINNDGIIVSSPFKKDIGKNVASLLANVKPLQPIMEYAGDRDYGNEINQGGYLTRMNRQPILVTFKSISSKNGIGGKSGWHLIRVAPTSLLYADLQMVGQATLLLAVVFGGIAVWLSFKAAAWAELAAPDRQCPGERPKGPEEK